MIKTVIKKIVEKIKPIKPNKKDPLVVSHRCTGELPNGKSCKAAIYENKKLDFQLRGECDRPCLFKAELFAMVYVPQSIIKKK